MKTATKRAKMTSSAKYQAKQTKRYLAMRHEAEKVARLASAAFGHPVQVDCEPQDGCLVIAKHSLSAPAFWRWYMATYPQWHPTPIDAALNALSAWKAWRTHPENPNRE